MYGMPFNLTTITAHIAPIVVKIALLFIVAILVSYIIYIFWLLPSWETPRTPSFLLHSYKKSKDGIHFERLPYPVFVAENVTEARKHYPYTSPARLTYDTETYTSGGGWGGAEDPRAVKMNGRIFLTFNIFNGWESMRVALTSIDA